MQQKLEIKQEGLVVILRRASLHTRLNMTHKTKDSPKVKGNKITLLMWQSPAHAIILPYKNEILEHFRPKEQAKQEEVKMYHV